MKNNWLPNAEHYFDAVDGMSAEEKFIFDQHLIASLSVLTNEARWAIAIYVAKYAKMHSGT